MFVVGMDSVFTRNCEPQHMHQSQLYTNHCHSYNMSFYISYFFYIFIKTSDTGNFDLLQASSNFLARCSSEGSLWRIYKKSLNLGSGLVKIWSSTADRSLRVRFGAGISSFSASRLMFLEIRSLE